MTAFEAQLPPAIESPLRVLFTGRNNAASWIIRGEQVAATRTNWVAQHKLREDEQGRFGYRFDPRWFAILFVINMELAFLTPPFGFNLFYMKAVVPSDVNMWDIYKSATPFVLLMILGLTIRMVFPGIITWLPGLMRS